MKDSCSECGSKRIIPEVWVVDQSPNTSNGFPADNALRVRIDGDPKAWFWKDAFYSKLVARICGDCGRTELRVKDPGALYQQYLAAQGGR